MMYYTRLNTRMCEIILVGDEAGLSHLHLDTGEGKRVFEIADDWEQNHAFFAPIIQQIEEYMQGQRSTFDIPLNPKGTEYQKKVWQALREIPYAKLHTYKNVATAIGNPKASRAVGMANSRNPLPLVVPCHRVVGANGQLTGFAHGLTIKKRLIHLEKLMSVYHTLFAHYGEQHWWPAKSAYEMMVGAILTQNTNWSNVEKALDNFKDRLTPQFVASIGSDELAEIIRPSGYYNQKAANLKSLTAWFMGYGCDVDTIKQKSGEALRHELLELRGVGRETADSILLYALDKPFFVIDTYTKRLFHRLGIDLPKTYDELRLLVEDALPHDLYLFNEYHGLIVQHAKHYCTKKPQCHGCPLNDVCEKRN